MPHEPCVATRHGHTWIHKYIFPGGQIPSLQAISDALRAHTSLRISSDLAMGRTTRARSPNGAPGSSPPPTRWRGSASARPSSGCGTSTSPTPKAGFRARYLDVHQLILERRS